MGVILAGLLKSGFNLLQFSTPLARLLLRIKKALGHILLCLEDLCGWEKAEAPQLGLPGVCPGRARGGGCGSRACGLNYPPINGEQSHFLQLPNPFILFPNTH